jgi:cytochrome c-type biogenesis protein CcmF
VQPLIAWLWTGGGIMAFGTFLAAWPGRKRRPTAPDAEPVAGHDEVAPEPAGVAS